MKQDVKEQWRSDCEGARGDSLLLPVSPAALLLLSPLRFLFLTRENIFSFPIHLLVQIYCQIIRF
jgi:hypothetical protein